MNYEEKYKEILEWARKNKARLNGVPIEEVLPELAESEDERIRKEIVEFIRSQIEDGNSVGWDRWIAYLEKQKENPKPADSISSDCISDVKCEDRDSNYGVFPEDVIVVARACEKLKTHGYPELAYALKNVNLYTKEQKPAEWSEEDIDMLTRVINQVGGYTYFAGMDSERVVNWLKSLRPSWKPSENELAKKHLDGYCMGREDTLREMKDFIESHFNTNKAEG